MSLVAVAIDWGLFKLLKTFPTRYTLVAAAAVFAATRLAAGAMAHTIYYARFGKWPHVDEETQASRD